MLLPDCWMYSEAVGVAVGKARLVCCGGVEVEVRGGDHRRIRSGYCGSEKERKVPSPTIMRRELLV